MKYPKLLHKLFWGLLVGLGFLLLDGNLCVVKRFSGLPCPGCGMTRAYLSLIHFKLQNAWYFHPLFFLPPLIAGVVILRKQRLVATLYRNNFFWVALGLLVIIVWAARLATLFPHVPPMDYDPNALLPTLLRLGTRLGGG